MRLALAPLNATIGDLAGNCAKARAAVDRARIAGADLVVLPELWICGYPPRDLLLQEGFVEACSRAARDLGERASPGITLVFGCPLPGETRRSGGAGLHNSLLAYRDGKLVDYYDKRLLPTYDVFDEDRYFEPGARPVTIDVGGRLVGLAICEDLWRAEDVGFSSIYRGAPDPVEDLARAGASVVIVPSASPFALGKGGRQREILRAHARRHGLFIAGVNQLGGNDELIFDGDASIFDPEGRLLAAGPGFSDELLVADVPEVPGASIAEPPARAEEESIFRALSLGVRDYLAKTGHREAIVGLSGGIDSAVTAAIAAAALGPGCLTGIAMPGPYSSEHSRADARDLAARLGCRLVEVPITGAVDGVRSPLDAAFGAMGRARLGASLPDIAEENLQSRVRGTVLMAISNRTGAIVLTTGNKSELSVGYCTLYGDMNGGLAVLSDVTKAWVYRLARWMNAHPAAAGFSAAPIPESSISKPPSAELRPDQRDQDTLPPYDILDAVVERYIERRQAPATIVRETGFDAATVARLVRLIDASEHKRKQLATGLKVTGVAFGVGRRFPIAQGWGRA